MAAQHGKCAVNKDIVTRTMTGSTNGVISKDGIHLEIEDDIQRQAARRHCRGTGDAAPKCRCRAQLLDIRCPPRRVGTSRGRRGQEAECP